MTSRTEKPTRKPVRPTTVRRGIAAAAIVAGISVVGFGAPAQAAIPASTTTNVTGTAAKTWSTLMYRSLTAPAQAALLRTTLATQQTAVTTQATAIATAKALTVTTQTQLTAATTTDADMHARYSAALTALNTAKSAAAKASKQKPKSKSAVTKTTKAVTTATNSVDAMKPQVQAADAVLKEAKTGAQTATTGLSSATAAWNTATAAVTQTQAKIAAVPDPAVLAAQAAALSQTVVTQVRASFTMADTIQIYGITVNKNVSYAFKQMVDAAAKDGIVMSGGGFRTTQRQIELRTINGCPDVWTSPSTSCRVPTAIPGHSLHEIGLAVDMTVNGKTITKSSPAFAWLSAHAKTYGFINYPAEAWHWSITGS